MKTISTKFARLFVLAVCFGIATMSASVQASTFRYLKLDVTAQVGSLVPSFYEIQWMVDATSYPSAAVTDDNLILSNYPGKHSWTDKRNAFDKLTLTTGDGHTPADGWSPFDDEEVTVLPYFITIDLGAGNEIYPTAIGLTIAYKGRGLAAFTCEGSNDNNNWANLLTVTGLVEDNWITDATKSFNIPAPIIAAMTPISEQSFVLYPNPVQNVLNLNFGSQVKNAQVSILDLQGRSLMSQSVAHTQVETLDVSSLSNGIYFVKVTADGKVMNSKFVKK